MTCGSYHIENNEFKHNSVLSFGGIIKHTCYTGPKRSKGQEEIYKMIHEYLFDLSNPNIVNDGWR